MSETIAEPRGRKKTVKAENAQRLPHTRDVWAVLIRSPDDGAERVLATWDDRGMAETWRRRCSREDSARVARIRITMQEIEEG